jgi:Protein of unknown function (DUF3237)
MKATHITTLTAIVGAPVMLGPVLGGLRGIVPIAGGSFNGPRLRGKVVPMGADWALLQPDGSAHVDARYLLQMEDGTFVGIRNSGFSRPVAGQDNVYAGQSRPEFEAPIGSPYAWMNEATFTCTFTSDLSKGEVSLRFYLIEPDATP